MSIPHFDSLIIGGGAAGFFAAVNAARLAPGKSVCILEKSNKVLAKVRVSGGGRCNVTHACYDNRELVKFYPRGAKELRGAFSRFNPSDTVEWFESRGVELKTEDDGRMFPVTDDSETIAQCLLTEANKYNVEIRLHSDVTGIEKTENGFLLQLNDGEKIACGKLLIATGGHPKSAGYSFLRMANHTIIPPVPSLFTFNLPNDPVRELMGVSVEHAVVKIEGTNVTTEGPLLITHWGMSGPAVLKASAWGARELAEMNYRFAFRVTWLPGKKEEEVFETLERTRKHSPTQQVSGGNPFFLPKRLWQYFTGKAEIKNELRWADLTNKQLRRLVQLLLADRYEANGKTTFKEEFVTCGGVALTEVDFKTMESRKVKDLFFAGEVLDIDGVTGGFNFQSAWTTGWLAAQAMSAK